VHVEVREMPAKMLGPVGADNRAQVINKAHLSDTRRWLNVDTLSP